MFKKIKENKKYQVIIIISIMLISIVLSVIASNPDSYKHTILTLDERREDALILTSSTAAAAVGVSAIPGDMTEPIAELFTNISSYSILITCIIFIEKFFITIFGFAGFAVFIPVSCILALIYLNTRNSIFKSYAIKLSTFGLILAFIVPLSTGFGVVIEKTAFKDYEKAVVELEASSEDTNLWDKLKEKTDEIVKQAKNKINHFIDVIAVMLITTCFIPLGVMTFLLWLIKIIFNVEIKAPNPQKLSAKLNSERKKITHREENSTALIEN